MLVWGEARGEPLLGLAAVAHIPLTRMRTKATSEPSSGGATSGLLSSVILKPWQFSCFNQGPSRDNLLKPAEHDKAWIWDMCYRIAEGARNGTIPNPAAGATHFCSRALWDSVPVPGKVVKWHEAPLIASGTTKKVVAIGSHVFARTP